MKQQEVKQLKGWLGRLQRYLQWRVNLYYKKKEMKLLQRISELNKSKEFKKLAEKAEKALNDYKGEES